ncbi:MAG: DUF2550 family protein [Acidimicrobiia bacterium]
MTTLVLVAIAASAILGAAMGLRHLYLRLDRPRGVSCSLRVAHGEHPGLGSKFHAGYAGPEMDRLLWRRIAWPDPPVRFPVARIRVDRERRPAPSERLALPASFSIVPVELDDGVELELALSRHRLHRIVALLDGDGPERPGR